MLLDVLERTYPFFLEMWSFTEISSNVDVAL